MTTLSDATWSALAAEYLDDRDDAGAGANALKLAEYVNLKVQTFDFGEWERFVYPSHHWVPVDDPEPYAGLEELKRAWDAAHVIHVSDCYHDHPVFSRLDNLRFRVWHDSGHVIHDLGFDRVGELDLFIVQARSILKERFHVCWPTAKLDHHGIVEALFSESVYQLAAAIHLGTFPDQQHVRTPGPVARALLDAWGLSRP
jgi:hypothetical protein